MGAVKSDPKAAKIMACHDLQVAICVWRNLYVKIVKVPDVVRVRFNHAEEGGRYCRALASWNFVTHKCNDLPDWRTAGISEERRVVQVCVSTFSSRFSPFH